jgi:methyl-accepting chemotaxis protein
VSSLRVVPVELATTASRVTQAGQTLEAVAQSVARVHAPDTGSTPGSGQAGALLHQLAAAVQALSELSQEGARRLHTAGGGYVEAERRAAGGRLCE